MKQTIKITTSIILVLTLLFCAVACGSDIDTSSLWENAIYSEDTTLGEGANTVTVKISAGDKSVTLTVSTDKATLGEALYEHGLVNDMSFFDTCNGIKADCDADAAYWAFYIGDESTPAKYGIGDEKATTAGAPSYRIVYYRIVYTK